MPDIAYRLHRLRVDLGQRTVIDLPDVEIASGRVTVVAGPNGAGKTTLLRVLALLLAPSAGRVAFLGQNVEWQESRLRRLRSSVTLVAQSPLLFRRSVRSNIEYGLRRHGLAADGRIEKALAAVGLDGFADRPAWKLSGGEVQRVAIARALAIDPPVVLLDEPTANVDRQYVGVIQDVVRQLAARGRTVVLTTHSQELAARLSDALLFLGNVSGPANTC